MKFRGPLASSTSFSIKQFGSKCCVKNGVGFQDVARTGIALMLNFGKWDMCMTSGHRSVYIAAAKWPTGSCSSTIHERSYCIPDCSLVAGLPKDSRLLQIGSHLRNKVLKEIYPVKQAREVASRNSAPWIQTNPCSFITMVELHRFSITPCSYKAKNDLKVTFAGENLDF